MKKISAQIIADSVNKQGDRITSMVLTFPRFILAELNTHRMFSKNSASSRAIPFKKMVEMVETDLFIPIAWQKDHKGMQGDEYFDLNEIISSEGHTRYQVTAESWLEARDEAVRCSEHMNEMGLTKQLCNRLLEPFAWHTVILTATEFDNFFKLRCPQYEHKDNTFYKSKKDWVDGLVTYNKKRKEDTGIMCKPNIPNTTEKWLKLNKGQSEIHMMELAECMWDAMNESIPALLNPGDWHIPFGSDFDKQKLIELRHQTFSKVTRSASQFKKHLNILKRRVATARCARVSYLNYEGKDDYSADVKLYDRLLDSGHMSPFEHVAQCMTESQYEYYGRNLAGNSVGSIPYLEDEGWCRNFKGFIQLRENIDKNV